MALTPYKRACFENALLRKVASDPRVQNDLMRKIAYSDAETGAINGRLTGMGIGTGVGAGAGLLVNKLLKNKTLLSYLLAGGIGGIGGGILGTGAGDVIGRAGGHNMWW